jgi:hypothetical protein
MDKINTCSCDCESLKYKLAFLEKKLNIIESRIGIYSYECDRITCDNIVVCTYDTDYKEHNNRTMLYSTDISGDILDDCEPNYIYECHSCTKDAYFCSYDCRIDKNYCYECSPRCFMCKEILIITDPITVMCGECDECFCKTCSKTCKTCNEHLCNKCCIGEICNECNKTICN